MSEQIISDLQTKMAKAIEITRQDLSTIRTGRASPALIENIIIPAYGGSQKLKVKELATISTADSKTLVVIPFDPATIEEIGKGIQEANVGLTPIVEADQVRISIPPLSEERRQQYLRLAKAKLEAGKVIVRQVRQEGMSKLKRAFEAKEITEDDRKRLAKQIQDVTDEMVAEIEHLGKAKEEELLSV